MKKLLAVAVFLGLAMAQTIAEITRQVQANLERSPWEATLTGRVQMPDGSTQEAEFRLQVIPRELARVEFKKPAALEGNFVVISEKEVWNYLFLTNQLIIQPRAKARVEGLGVNLTDLSDLEQLTERVTLRLLGEQNTPAGAAWRIGGVPKDASLGFASMELLVLKADPRPLYVTLRDANNRVLAELGFSGFRRTNLTPQALRKRPADAEVIRRN
ncbi:MAG: outer membrane lipoprotein carrier protein LolA [Meiothermus sp.]|uniref:outer membrane lipoprotein carrier protein LolA n=1 Tax=Meiothermus sp. TaxID=1955249 RepID=UPI0025FAC2BA|nr:outer membrane lipoprotein carrier protein LolA [Meiothermus sp.]MCS7059509.1 outer membrane lipoprotein carrier protein LolA [Meiothermus sp.]MCS7193586.1 outer membrane lipoprotein carrier protein LolA [Meiothermus sp.]MDW8090599.1 outer membrane lipoprotein carrier protein LolA [Meiothermus sp.]MDW8480515.1 outer membrane lipoprotein carrier protein LolA [Meiothermus sp.]